MKAFDTFLTAFFRQGRGFITTGNLRRLAEAGVKIAPKPELFDQKETVFSLAYANPELTEQDFKDLSEKGFFSYHLPQNREGITPFHKLSSSFFRSLGADCNKSKLNSGGKNYHVRLKDTFVYPGDGILSDNPNLELVVEGNPVCWLGLNPHNPCKIEFVQGVEQKGVDKDEEGVLSRIGKRYLGGYHPAEFLLRFYLGHTKPFVENGFPIYFRHGALHFPLAKFLSRTFCHNNKPLLFDASKKWGRKVLAGEPLLKHK